VKGGFRSRFNVFLMNGARALRVSRSATSKPWLRSRRTQMAIVDDLRSQGVISVRTIAAQLNERGVLTPRGGAVAPNVNRSVAGAAASLMLTGPCEGRGDRLLTLLAVLAHVRGAEFDGER
jgi:hypothetical protein